MGIQKFNEFHFRSCTLPLTFFQIPLNGNWHGILSIVPKLVEGGFSTEVRGHRRINSVTLLSTLFHNANLRSSVQAKDVKALLEKLTHTLTAFTQGEMDLKNKMLCEILHLIYGLYLSKSESIDWDQMKTLLEQVRDKVPKNRNFHEVKRAFNKISVPLKIKVVTGSEKKRSVFSFGLL